MSMYEKVYGAVFTKVVVSLNRVRAVNVEIKDLLEVRVRS